MSTVIAHFTKTAYNFRWIQPVHKTKPNQINFSAFRLATYNNFHLFSFNYGATEMRDRSKDSVKILFQSYEMNILAMKPVRVSCTLLSNSKSIIDIKYIEKTFINAYILCIFSGELVLCTWRLEYWCLATVKTNTTKTRNIEFSWFWFILFFWWIQNYKDIENVTFEYVKNRAYRTEHFTISNNPQKSAIFGLFDHTSFTWWV